MKKFKKIYVEITNICNLKCDFCPKTKRQLKCMSVDDFSKVITGVKPYTDYIYFHLMGEPLMHPNLAEFFNICFKNNLQVNLTTNGTLLINNISVLQVAKSLRKITISLHSFMANDNNALDKYVTNVLSSVTEILLLNNGLIIEFRLWDKSNLLTETIIKKIFNFYNIISTEYIQCKIKDNIYITTAEKFVWPSLSTDENDKLFCYGLRDQLGILVDGTVVPCCLDNEGENNLGNIFNDNLVDILKSEKATSIYKGFSERRAVTDLCKKCSYAKRFR